MFDTKVIGTGTFQAAANTLFAAGFEFDQSVSAWITVSLTNTRETHQLIISKPLQFLAAIDGIDAGPQNKVVLPNTPFADITKETFSNDQLKLFDGHRLVANLNIVGDFTVGNFAFSADGNGGTLIRFTQTPAMATMPDHPPIVPSMAHS